MPVLCDFQVIRGDNAVKIGDGSPEWETTFNTGGRRSSGHAFLMFNVKGLTHTNDSVPVRVNNTEVGRIYPYGGEGETANRWYTQLINIGGGVLRDGNNEIEIPAVSWPGAGPGNLYDDFFLKDVICFFQQSA
jgi:hypothetical protein